MSKELKNMTIGYSSLTERIFLGKSSRPGVFTGDKKDITSEFIHTIIEWCKPEEGSKGCKRTIARGDGTPDYEITVKRIK